MYRLRVKHNVNPMEVYEVSPLLLQMLGSFCTYVYLNYGLQCEITSLKEDAPNRKYSTHRDGRAVDIAARPHEGWTPEIIRDVLLYIDTTHRHIGAISAKDGRARPAIYHDVGNGAHFHLQVRPIPNSVKERKRFYQKIWEWFKAPFKTLERR
jgi:hypothetical protein